MRKFISFCVIAISTLVSSQAVAGWGPANIEEDILSVVNGRFTRTSDLVAAVSMGYEPGWANTALGQLAAENAADAILAHRAGPDGIYGTGDDNPFDSLLEIWKVDGVGGEAMEGLEAFVTQWAVGAPLGSAILDLVNEADASTLDDGAGLSARASGNLVSYRDGGQDLTVNTNDDEYVAYERIFGTSRSDDSAGYSVDAVPYVGASSIQKLYDFAMLAQ